MTATTTMAASPNACPSPAVVSKVLPSVVNITVVKVVAAKSADPSAQGATSQQGRSGSQEPEQIQLFVGSGFVIDPSGVIVTNKHVIQDAAAIQVTFNNRLQVPAQLIAAASLVDLAVLQVHMPQPLPALHYGNSDALELGQPVIAIGNPIGLGTSVSTGVISGINRNLMRTPFDDYLQTDASINPGNSGGPLLDCDGEVIGVNTALLSNSKVLGSIGLGFALPSHDVEFVAKRLRSPDAPALNWIGVRLQDLTQQLAGVFGRPDMTGAIVTGTDPGSPAARAGLLPGDVIIGINGQPASDARATLRDVVTQPSGSTVSLSFWRHGQTLSLTLTGQPWPNLIAERAQVLASSDRIARAEAEGTGLHLSLPTASDRRRFDLGNASGVLVDRVTPGSQAETMGLKVGDLIAQVDDQPATTPVEVMQRLGHPNAAQGDFVALLVRSAAVTRWVTLFVGRIDVANLIASPAPETGRPVAHDAVVPQQ